MGRAMKWSVLPLSDGSSQKALVLKDFWSSDYNGPHFFSSRMLVKQGTFSLLISFALLSFRTWCVTQLRLWFEYFLMVALGRSLVRRVMPVVSAYCGLGFSWYSVLYVLLNIPVVQTMTCFLAVCLE